MILWRRRYSRSLKSSVAGGIVLFSRTMSPACFIHSTKMGLLVALTLQSSSSVSPTSYVTFGVLMLTVIVPFTSLLGIVSKVVLTVTNIKRESYGRL